MHAIATAVERMSFSEEGREEMRGSNDMAQISDRRYFGIAQESGEKGRGKRGGNAAVHVEKSALWRPNAGF
jgi:hypothetical protein